MNNKLMIAFRGLNNILEERALKEWAANNHFDLQPFNYLEVEDAIEFVRGTPIRHLEILGFSLGAASAYELARKTPLEYYQRLITVEANQKINSTFGKERKPLRNVGVHLNFATQYNQDPDFSGITIEDIEPFKVLECTLKFL